VRIDIARSSTVTSHPAAVHARYSQREMMLGVDVAMGPEAGLKLLWPS
jgi:hypothetical protein